MTGDTDSSRYDDFDITFDEFDYIKEWWNEYIKVYSVEKYSDNDIYRVGYEEVGEGAWNIDAINQLFKDKTVKVFTFDHGSSTVKMNVSKDTLNSKINMKILWISRTQMLTMIRFQICFLLMQHTGILWARNQNIWSSCLSAYKAPDF